MEESVVAESDAVSSELPANLDVMSAAEMYDVLCSACHGVTGNADGPGARSVWPPPRNFRNDKFRLVSNDRRVPSIDDIESVLRNGMPGTSMKSYADLTSRQRKFLSEEVLRLRENGIRDRIRRSFQEETIADMEGEVQSLVHVATEPGNAIQVPNIGSADDMSIARGQRLYQKQGCVSCHGADGVGSWDTQLRNDDGQPTRARDLVHEMFKGGHEPASIFLRLRLGMPGTPHPANANLTDEELIDLTHYCKSLEAQTKLILTGHQRRTRASSQSYLRSLGRTKPITPES